MNQAGFGRAPAQTPTAAAPSQGNVAIQSARKRSVGWHVLLVGIGLDVAAYLSEAISASFACVAVVVILVASSIAGVVFPGATDDTRRTQTPGDSRWGISLATLLCVFAMLAAIVIAIRILGLFGDGFVSFVKSITP